MKKLVLLAATLAMVSGSALAADMPMKALKAPPPAPFDPWDIAFGSAIMSDYMFRGITQSNHNPSVAAYFEPRYNVNKDLQLYVGTSFESISFPNRAAAETDIYGGIRPTFGAFAFDFGVFGYLYPGGTCYYGAPVDFAGNATGGGCADERLSTATSPRKMRASSKAMRRSITPSTTMAVGANEYYSPNFLNTGAWGNYASITGKYTAPGTYFGSQRHRHVRLRRVRPPVARNLRQLLRRSGVPERHQVSRLQHLEYRHWLHLQGVHAGPALLRHRPVEGRLQRLHQRLHTRGNITATPVPPLPRSIRRASAPTGAVRPVLPSCRLT